MLFHTWPFAAFLAIVLPVYFALRRTRLWIPWLLMASYVFYGWWNPYYLFLVLYSTTLDFFLAWLMEKCPRGARQWPAWRQIFGLGFSDPLLRRAYWIAIAGAAICWGIVAAGPESLRPAIGLLSALFLLMAAGAIFRNRRVWLVVSLINNLTLLAFFKYANFFVTNANTLLGWMRLSWQLPDPSTLMPFGWTYILPVGISFYTFQSLSYAIDFYRGQIARERNFLRFATFVAFFPQLVAGPIERASHLLPQFHRPAKVTLEDLTDGLSLFVVGLFKKLALANYLSFYVDRVYERPESFDAPALMLATFAFAWQIFFDFSGYTDMARGVARMMGFNLMLNFNNPYLATGLGDFWGRWHISLSTWFRDYVYIPLGGNRRGKFHTYRNLFLTLLISAVWHGAAWTFVIWGLLHAIGIVITRELERSAWYREKLPRVLKQLPVFVFVCVTWIFFRAETVHDAFSIVGRIFSSAWTDPQMPLLMAGIVMVIWLYQFAYESEWRPWLRLAPVRVGLATAMMLYMFLFSSGGGAFIYFQF